ncbi:MAG: glycerol kinase GlpK [Thermoguttaceae bacterium]|nr:glycerol kinase GlpK [Thermoguttaceae bacterium]MDW8077542.1 glycerol kinase GlpK [Thermoguttaceae bacterium]
MEQFILALDQGTTSSRAILFDRNGRPVASAQQELPQILPAPGIVEHDPEAIWHTQLRVAREAIARAEISPRQVAALGVTNQRETTILWDRATGKPVANAIVWQSRVSAPICQRWKTEGLEVVVRRRTGLVVDPYFSASKVAYLLESVDGLRRRCERGEVLFGTVDTWLIWRLSGGKCHVTDPSNASRTMFFNIHTLQWDGELLRAMGIPSAILPQVCPSSGMVGVTSREIFGEEIPIAGIAGDQQAATFGQTCFQPGDAKNTYGTGCFLLMNTGTRPVASTNNLLTTIGWQVNNKVTYCLEGSVFVAGAVVQWLRDNLGLIKASADVESLAATVPDSGGVYFVPAFVGLGAPYWDPYARGAILGLSRSSTAGHIARAALESMAYQTKDLVEAMEKDSDIRLQTLRVDGGASVNNMLMQFQADILGVPVRRPKVRETTALGAAFLAGLAVGFWESEESLSNLWALDREFLPQMDANQRSERYRRWCEAVYRTRSWATPETC